MVSDQSYHGGQADGSEPSQGQRRHSTGRFDPTVPALLLGLVLVLFAGYFSFKTLFGAGPLDAMIKELDQSSQSLNFLAQSGEKDTEEGTTGSDAVPVVTSAEIFSWWDDDGDHPEMAGYLIDKNSDTIWRSRYFAGNTFAEGAEIAILLNLAEPAPVSSITLDVIGSGGLLKVTEPNENNPRDGAVLATVELSPSTVVTFDPAIEMDSIGLVFETLPTDDEGRLRAKISGITVE